MTNADLFFQYLFENGFCEPFEWKNTSKQTSLYSVLIYCTKCVPPAMHTVDVYVIDKKHYVRDRIIKQFRIRHPDDFDKWQHNTL